MNEDDSTGSTKVTTMTRLHLVSAYPGCTAPAWLTRHATPLPGTEVTDDPETADIILFVEQHPGHDPYFNSVARHPIYRRHKAKCVLYHDADRSITRMPTLSPSIELWQYDPRHHRSCHYIARIEANAAVDNHVPDFRKKRRYLANFMGSSRTHPIRHQVLALADPDFKLHDTDVRYFWEVPQKQRNAFVEICDDSYFVLCPRGAGPSSYRLFEAMQLGRVPVVISDEWVPIQGIQWDKCSLRVPEAEVGKLPAMLRSRQFEAVDMGREARRIWEERFAPEVSLHTLAALASDVLKQPFGTPSRLRAARQFLNPYHFKNLLRVWKRRVRSRLRIVCPDRRTFNPL